MLTLGSLFDGSGGFPLAGILAGIKPVWSSEIEPFPLRVTAARLPSVKHLGSVTDINGAQIEPVDIITFGSPCQDLSVAGKQLGIHEGQRSNLFFEAVRIIKEMRNEDKTNGRTGKHIRPRFAVWENVPGAFSSNKGEDFRAVLEALASVVENDISIPRPKKWDTGGGMAGNGWSVAWRVYDAQYWGVPQRRKRIYLVADFGSERAIEILSVSKSVCGDTAKGRTPWEGTAADVERSTRGSGGVRCLNPWDYQSYRLFGADGAFATLQARENSGLNHQGIVYEPRSLMEENWAAQDVKNALRANASRVGSCVVEPSAFMGGQGAKAGGIGYCEDGTTPTLRAAESGSNQVPDVCHPINTMVATRGGKDDMRTCFGIGEPSDPQFTISAAHEHWVCYALQGNGIDRSDTAGCNGCGWRTDQMYTLNTIDRPAVCYGVDCRNGVLDKEKTHTIQAKANGGISLNCTPSVCYSQQRIGQYREDEKSSTLMARDYKSASDLVVEPKQRKYIVRRLTPTECARLQGFPDWWTDGVEGTDSAKYKMWGNGIALPCAYDVLNRIQNTA